MSGRRRSPAPNAGPPLLASILFWSLTLGPPPAAAQSPQNKIRDFASTASGFTLLEDVEEGSLPQGDQAAFALVLLADVEYMIVGFCDDGCTNMDLAVLDPNDEEMESDRLPDPQPILMLRPVDSGVYHVLVDMASCSTGPCGFAVGILEGPYRERRRFVDQAMEDRLSVFRSDLLEEGFTETGFPAEGTMNQDQEVQIPLTLTAGVEYKLAGVCDDNCEDLNLTLLDPAGMEVTSDHLPDPYPLLTVIPTVPGEYRVAAQMVTCNVEPCGFVVSTFVQDEDFGPGGVPLTGEVVFRETYEGTLEAGDERLKEGNLVDTYTIQAATGQAIILDLRSPDFDTYLLVRSPGGQQEENDDWGDDTKHSHVEWVVPEAGTYFILVTSFAAEEVGAYTLQIALVDGS